MRRLLVVTLSFVAACGALYVLGFASSSSGERAPTAAAREIRVAQPGWGELARAEGVVEYVQVVERNELVAYLAAVEANEAAAYLASLPPPAPPPVATSGVEIPPPMSYSTSGPHSDAWWRGVSVCEQGGRNDPFFGYFSIMDGSAGGLDWSTQVGMANGIIARYGDGAWAASCVAAGYAASPSG